MRAKAVIYYSVFDTSVFSSSHVDLCLPCLQSVFSRSAFSRSVFSRHPELCVVKRVKVIANNVQFVVLSEHVITNTLHCFYLPSI